MAQYTAYAQYYIYFRDQAAYDAAIATYGASFFAASPNLMASLLGITNLGTTLGDNGIVSVEYSLSSPGTEILNPVASGVFLDPSLGAILVPGQLGGDDLLLTWAGIIVKAPSNAVTTVNISKRRFGGGFEVAPTGEGGASLASTRACCRDASRFVDGLGWAFRNETGVTFQRTLSEYGSVTAPTQSWERFYFRLRTAPSTKTGMWRSVGSISSNSGVRLSINADRTVTLDNTNSAGTITVTQTTVTALTLNQWARIDVLLTYSATVATASLYIDGTLQFTFAVTSGNGGLGQAQDHASSIMGDISSGGTNLIEIDIDEWENAQIPSGFDSADWLNGTRYKIANILSGTITDWLPTQLLSTNQLLSPLGSSTESRYTSSTALARIQGLTDVPLKTTISDLNGFQIGVIAALVGIYSSRVSVDGQLGYKLAGGADVLATILQSSSTIFNSVLYNPSGVLLPAEISPFSLVHTKGNSADASLVLAIQAVIGYLGIFGNEDNADYIAGFSRKPWTHNQAGANTLYANSGPYPNGNCAVKAGTYTGNGTFQSVNLPFIPHFIWIRNTGITTNGVCHWQACSLDSHFGGTDRVTPDYSIRVYVDNGQPKFTVCGDNAQINNLAATYQYVAFCDPGMRYNVCGSWRHQTTLTTAVNPLQNTLFTPELVLFQSDLINNASSTVMSALKGPGNTVDAGVRFDGTAQASFMTFALGSITSRANTHLGSSQVNYSAWRTNDGSVTKMVQILQYTGNGVASRVIPLTPATSKVPVFVIVQAVNGILYFRDPSHLTNTSSQFTLGSTTTGITAVGVDNITVGITLNSNGVVYNVFAIAGDAASMANGTYYAPSILPPSDAWFGGIAALGIDDQSGIYKLIPGKLHDTFWTRETSIDTEDVKIPDPSFKTGFLGG